MTVPAAAVGEMGDSIRWLVRMHVGLEGVEELWKDIEAALHAV